MYAQRVLNSDPFTRRTVHRRCTANSTAHHLHHHPWPSARVGGGSAGAARIHTHTHARIHTHSHTRTSYTCALHTHSYTYILTHTCGSHARPCIRTGWGTRWQQCVTDRPAYESRSLHRPIQLYIQGDFIVTKPFNKLPMHRFLI